MLTALPGAHAFATAWRARPAFRILPEPLTSQPTPFSPALLQSAPRGALSRTQELRVLSRVLSRVPERSPKAAPGARVLVLGGQTPSSPEDQDENKTRADQVRVDAKPNDECPPEKEEDTRRHIQGNDHVMPGAETGAKHLRAEDPGSPWKTGRGQDSSSPEPLEGAQPRRHLAFGLLPSRAVGGEVCGVLPPGCGRLSQQP